MRKQLITGPKRKRTVIVCLGAVSVVLLGISLKLAMQESSLPIATQLDESRLLEPSVVDVEQDRSALQFAITREGQLSDYVQCARSAGSGSKQACILLIEQMLDGDPANGRLWLEKAKILAGETGLGDQAISALKKSYDYSGREGWVSAARARFTLSVWGGLSQEIQDIAAANVIAMIADDVTQMQKITDLYAANPLARAGITAVLAKAPVDMQQRFLYQLRMSLKS